MVVILFIAHRGNGKHNYKENTKEAILKVLNEDVVGVEFDVRLTKDQKLIIYHDPILNGKIIRLSTFKELKKLDNKISNLDEILRQIKNNKIILIEIKSEVDDCFLISEIIYKTINKYNLNIYFCSFNKKIVDNLSKKYKNIGLIIGYYINQKYLINDYKFNIIHYKYENQIDKSKETFIWTINDKKRLEKIGYDAYIITDKYYLIK